MKTTFEFNADGRSSTDYLGTVDHKSDAGKLIISALRREWKRRGELAGKNFRVVLKGRLGKNNEHAFKYSKNVRRSWTWAYQTFGPRTKSNVRLDEAAHADIYVYERYNH